MKDTSYFGKIVLLIFLSIGAFYAAKTILPERLFPERSVNNDNILIDSLLLEAIAVDDINKDSIIVQQPDSIDKVLSDSINSDGSQFADAISDPTITNEGYQNLNRFFTKLYNLEKSRKGKVRIAYFGDSMNDGDLIVQDIRTLFQDTYGGQGVGFVSITSLSAQSRYSVAHQYSKDWKNQSFINVKNPNKPFGIDGQVAMGAGGQNFWVQYKAMGLSHCTQLYNATLFYGQSENENVYLKVKADKDSIATIPLVASKLLNTQLLGPQDPKSLRVEFYNIDSMPIYGFNFDDGQGVHIDNFSLRGNSGLPLSVLNSNLMNAFDRILNYDLIILQYGANVLSHQTKSYNWYERNMQTVVENLHICFPNADILILSTADKSSKIDNEMKTDPAVHILLQAQKNYAQHTHSGFIDLYTLMGGENSMIQWVKEDAGKKDYTHLTSKGSKKMAKLIYDEVNKAYLVYKLIQQGEVQMPVVENINTTTLPTDTLKQLANIAE